MRYERTCVPWAITDIFRMFAGLSMSARILNHVSRTPTQTEFATHSMHTSSTVKLNEAIQLAIFRTIDACSDFEQPQYQTRSNTGLEQGGLMVTILLENLGWTYLTIFAVFCTKSFCSFFVWVYPALQDRGLARPVMLDTLSDLKGF